MLHERSRYMKVLITGAAGFIGQAISAHLLKENKALQLTGVDNFDAYYARSYKEYRLTQLNSYAQFNFTETDVCSQDMQELILRERPEVVILAAAKVGVSYGEAHSDEYVRTNIIGLNSTLNALQKVMPKHVVFFSSSSVYGSLTMQKDICLSEDLPITTHTPLSIYGITKATGESLLHNFAKKTSVPVTIIRPFSVYGPSGRPDMLPGRAMRAVLTKETLSLFDSNRLLARDWTYIDDLVRFIGKLIVNTPPVSLQVLNVGSGAAVTLDGWITLFQKQLVKEKLHLKTRTVPSRGYESHFNQADNTRARALGFLPATSLAEGLHNTIHFFIQHPQFLYE